LTRLLTLNAERLPDSKTKPRRRLTAQSQTERRESCPAAVPRVDKKTENRNLHLPRRTARVREASSLSETPSMIRNVVSPAPIETSNAGKIQ
jgi:hypothetical protein